MYILGLDCGGTASKALLATGDGHVLGYGDGGPANYVVNGVDGVVRSALQAMQGCLTQVPLDLPALQDQGVYLALGVSGAGRELEMNDVQQAFQTVGFDQVVVSHDAAIALLGALGGADGVVVIAGTGSIAYGLEKEQSTRIGGWGYLLGDEGSAFWISLRALQQVMWGFDGRTRQDPILYGAVQEYFEVSDAAQLVPLLYQTPLNRGNIGGFSKEITRLAHQGHGFSQEVLAEAGRQLGNLAVAALRNLGLVEKKGRVGVSGGVFAAGQWVLPFMQEQIWQVAPNQTLTLPDFDPAAGAVLMAARHFQLDMERVAAGLRRSL